MLLSAIAGEKMKPNETGNEVGHVSKHFHCGWDMLNLVCSKPTVNANNANHGVKSEKKTFGI